MLYLAHINEDKQEQTLKEHLENTAERCGKFAAAGSLHHI